MIEDSQGPRMAPEHGIELPPDPHLLESMRAVGYSFETAVADVIDNSIAAGATTVHLLTTGAGTPQVSIFDDGDGMTRDVAIQAMRLAARSPSDTRSSTDLGRFGLGLKTASLSQCRVLTVATKRQGQLTLLRWDIDHVIDTGRWLVTELAPDSLSLLFGHQLLEPVSSGTLICWNDLDLLTMAEGSAQAELDAAVVRVRDHCSLVFHRFIVGDEARKISMTVNGALFPQFDPFLSRNRATDRQVETLRVDGQTLPVIAYTLPFVDKLSSAERKMALAPGAFRDSQGFYIYRAGRLVIWGTWFRLNPKSESGKLARVRVDVPNTLDHRWALDIKKSSASPPRELRDALRHLASQFVSPSARVQKFRGRRENDTANITRMWDVIVDRNTFRYELNKDHPLIRAVSETLDSSQLSSLDALLGAVEQTFPVQDAHNRLGEDNVLANQQASIDSAVAKAISLRSMFATTHPDDDSFIAMLEATEPYSHIDGFRDSIRAALRP